MISIKPELSIWCTLSFRNITVIRFNLFGEYAMKWSMQAISSWAYHIWCGQLIIYHHQPKEHMPPLSDREWAVIHYTVSWLLIVIFPLKVKGYHGVTCYLNFLTCSPRKFKSHFNRFTNALAGSLVKNLTSLPHFSQLLFIWSTYLFSAKTKQILIKAVTHRYLVVSTFNKNIAQSIPCFVKRENN